MVTVPEDGLLPLGFEERVCVVSDSIRCRRCVSLSTAEVPGDDPLPGGSVLGDEGVPEREPSDGVPLFVPAFPPPAGRLPEVTPPVELPPPAPLPPAPWAYPKLSGVSVSSPVVSTIFHDNENVRILLSFL